MFLSLYTLLPGNCYLAVVRPFVPSSCVCSLQEHFKNEFTSGDGKKGKKMLSLVCPAPTDNIQYTFFLF